MIKAEMLGMTTLSPWKQSDVSPVVVALEGASSSGAGGRGEPVGEGEVPTRGQHLRQGSGSHFTCISVHVLVRYYPHSIFGAASLRPVREGSSEGFFI